MEFQSSKPTRLSIEFFAPILCLYPDPNQPQVQQTSDSALNAYENDDVL